MSTSLSIKPSTALALREPHVAVLQEPLEVLSFRIGAEDYGIDILRVQEIRGYAEPTRIANAPSAYKGVLNLRGEMVPIVDLRVQLGVAQPVFDHRTVTIVIHVGQRVFGLVVDAVSDVLELQPEQVKPRPGFSGLVGADFITGLGSVSQNGLERLLILLDIEGLVASSEFGTGPAALQ
jgi:purine-binding chemotaxis protein CheW